MINLTKLFCVLPSLCFNIFTFFLFTFYLSFAQDGSLDITFGTDGVVKTSVGTTKTDCESMAIQSDGKILVAGYYFGPNLDFVLIRYNPDGTIDNTFDNDGVVTVTSDSGIVVPKSIALQSDGKIVVAGYISGSTDSSGFLILRFNENGSLDNTFDNDGIVLTSIGSNNDVGTNVAIQSDGKIVVAGYSRNSFGKYVFTVIRYNTNGTLDNSFDSDGIVTTAIGIIGDYPHSMAIQSNGKIIICGRSNYNLYGSSVFAMVRYNTNGTLDNTFDGDGIVTTQQGELIYCHEIKVQSNGKILISGSKNQDFALFRFNANGTLDNTFDSDGIVTTDLGSNDGGNSLAIQLDGKILVGGVSNNDFAVVRYNTNGILDNTFDSDGIIINDMGGSTFEMANSIGIQSDGKIILAGNTDDEFALVRFGFGPLNGSYDIGSGGDYTTISDAVYDLYFKGIAGTVKFTVLDGTYNEQFNFDGNIVGSNSTNNILFDAGPNVIVNYSASSSLDNYVLKFNSAKYLTFNNFNFSAGGTSFATVVKLENDCSDLEFNGNTFNSYNIPNSGVINELEQSNFICIDNSEMNNISLVNNSINYGSYGIHLDLNNNNLSNNILIDGNSVTNSYYDNIVLKNSTAPQIKNNTLSTNWSFALTLFNCLDNFIISENKIIGGRLHLNACDGSSVNRGVIKNNFIASNYNGINLLNSSNVDIYFNSVNLFGTVNTTTFALGYQATSGGIIENVNVRNNIFNNFKSGYVVSWIETGTINNVTSNYNILNTNGTSFANLNNIEYSSTFSKYKTDFSLDTNSYNAIVTFISDTDLHIVSVSQPTFGISIAGITTDIDGNTRNDPPFIGADEFNYGGVFASLKVFLEGPYISNNMNYGLTLPSTSPYDGSAALTTPTNAVDWVLVELRDKNDETNIIESKSAYLLNDGRIVNIQNGGVMHFDSPSNQYFISVKHRNHLSVMSASAISL
ncbi:MAG: hypothetical protein IPM32_01920 [Ignavibacteriae bacterium]|nr:hypothetical protein [Ignavibacteriota bacterium]